MNSREVRALAAIIAILTVVATLLIGYIGDSWGAAAWVAGIGAVLVALGLRAAHTATGRGGAAED
ncbi:hypothetical protein CFN78_21965 [Amycolatopsis antarctica]|uniref:Uncharacterized protein n=1 Tax=Amycolatopsis antarctica TaxID=1854586 RepID=A0A263CYA5_9PSEU|nr:hypothetical protein [Amycolatopsis antarctica]OZM71132.1 hypothetical protein CFN78_21965 [Amycolatopsis antarctica]